MILRVVLAEREAAQYATAFLAWIVEDTGRQRRDADVDHIEPSTLERGQPLWIGRQHVLDELEFLVEDRHRAVA